MLSNGVIFIWTGTNASIPAGWSRVTDLDDKFPKGNTDGSTNPDVTGGTSTHTHTGNSHTHTMGTHTHTVYTGAGYFASVNSQFGDQFTINSNHTHPNATSSNETSVSIGSTTPTWQSVSNNPPFYSVIYITPASTAGGIPNLSLGLSDDSGFSNNTGKYNGYYKCDGNNSTPDLTDRYLVGASAGADAGTTGGSTTNIHTLTHSHTQTHTHTVSISASSDGGTKQGGVDPNTLPLKTHTHSETLDANTTAIGNDTITVTTTETVEPAYKKLIAIQNRSGTIYTPVGIIGLWLGTIANIPGNFEIVSSMYDKHLKITNTNGDIGNTGGSNTHNHASHSHSHGGTFSHTHTKTITSHPGQTGRDSDAGGQMATVNTRHDLTTSTATPSISSVNITSDTVSNEPEYRTVAFIKYKGEKGASILLNLI